MDLAELGDRSPLVEQLVAVDLLEVAEELLGGASLGGRLGGSGRAALWSAGSLATL